MNLPLKINRGDTTFDTILAHYLDPIKFSLTPKQEIIRKRWAEVLTLRLNAYSRVQIANKLIEDHGISLAQAYIDIRNSELLYGNVLKSDKAGTRAILYEYAHQFYQRAIQMKDLKAEAKALDLMAEFGGIKDMDDLQFNPEKLENKELKLVIPNEQLEILKRMNSSGVADFNKMNIIDINFEDIKNDK